MKPFSNPLWLCLLIFSFMILMAANAKAQTETKNNLLAAPKETKEKPKAKPGTYEFFGVDQKMVHAFTDDTLILIEEQRKDHEDISIALNFGVSVYIPARDVINNPAFKPLPEIAQE